MVTDVTKWDQRPAASKMSNSR